MLLSVGFYFTFLEYKISERRIEVMSLTVRLNINLKNLYREAIKQADLANTSDEERVLALNAIIQPMFDEISKQYPNYGIGYYDKRFDSIAAKAPNVFEYSIGVLEFLSVLFFIPYTVTSFIIRKFRIQLSSFAESILKDDCVRIDTQIFPELNPLLKRTPES